MQKTGSRNGRILRNNFKDKFHNAHKLQKDKGKHFNAVHFSDVKEKPKLHLNPHFMHNLEIVNVKPQFSSKNNEASPFGGRRYKSVNHRAVIKYKEEYDSHLEYVYFIISTNTKTVTDTIAVVASSQKINYKGFMTRFISSQ